jgi:hypothetical protein
MKSGRSGDAAFDCSKTQQRLQLSRREERVKRASIAGVRIDRRALAGKALASYEGYPLDLRKDVEPRLQIELVPRTLGDT